MSNENIEDKYPHWKDALFGNHNAVANLKCAVEYVFWHAVYAAIAIVGALIVAGIRAGKEVSRRLGRVGRPLLRGLERGERAVGRAANHKYAEKFGGAFVGIALVVGLLYIIGIIAYLVYLHPWAALGVVVGVVITLALIVIGVLLWEKFGDSAQSAANTVATKARATGEKATQTPGVRRVYGECPVNFSQPPKWFDKIFPEEDL